MTGALYLRPLTFSESNLNQPYKDSYSYAGCSQRLNQGVSIFQNLQSILRSETSEDPR